MGIRPGGSKRANGSDHFAARNGRHATWKRIAERPKIQPDVDSLHVERAESSELRATERRSLVFLFRPVPQSRRADRHVAWRRAKHLQPQNRSSVALHVLKRECGPADFNYSNFAGNALPRRADPPLHSSAFEQRREN